MELLLNKPTRRSVTDTTVAQEPPKVQYQGIGDLAGVLHLEEEGILTLEVERGIKYRLQANWKIRYGLGKLVGQMVYIKVYPAYNLKTQELSFRVVCFNLQRPEGFKNLYFKLSGVFQWIAQSKRPVLTIYRNLDSPCKNNEKAKLASHIPLIMRDVKPFKYHKDSEERPQFYMVEAKLLPTRGTFGFNRFLAEPCIPPRRLRKNRLQAQDVA